MQPEDVSCFKSFTEKNDFIGYFISKKNVFEFTELQSIIIISYLVVQNGNFS